MKRLPKYKKGGNTKTDFISEKTAYLISKEGMKASEAYAVANSMYEQQYKQVGGIQKPTINYNGENPDLMGLGQNPNFTPNPTFNIDQGKQIIEDTNIYDNKQTSQDRKMLKQYAWDSANGVWDNNPQNQNYKQQFFDVYGGIDIPTSAYTLGEGIETGNTLETVGSGLKLLTGLGRNAFAGAGNARRNNFILKDAQEKYRDSLTPDAQSFQMGGEMMPPPQEVDPNQVAEALQQGADPNEVLQMLMESGMSQEQATQLIEQIMQQLQSQQPTEEAVMQDGGKKYKALTGEYTIEKDRIEDEDVVAELEHREFLKTPTQEITQIDGENHENGGAKLTEEQIPDGSEVISDHLKLTKDQAKSFSEKYDLKLSTKDTYADILHKWNKKSGLEENVKEQEDLIKQIEKQVKLLEEKPEAETTINLNIDLLQKELTELEQEKQPLEEERKSVFDEVFKAQESQKPKEEKEDDKMQDGGMFNGDMVISYAKKHGISPDRAMELVNMYKNGGYRAYQSGGVRVANPFEDPAKFIKQTEFGTGYYGDVVLNNQEKVAQENARLHPELYSQFFGENQYTPKDPKAFQQAINTKYQSILADAEKTYGKDSQKYKDLQSQIEKDKFLQDQSVRGTEGKFGNYTSTRPNFALELLPKEDLQKVNAQGVNTISQLKNKFPDLYKKYVEPKGLTSDAWLGEINQPTVTPKPTDTAVEDTKKAGFDRGNSMQTRMGIMALPDQYAPLPDALQGNLKLEYRPNLVDKQNVTAEPIIAEIRRQEQSAMQAIQNLPDAQRASAIAQLQANTQDQINKVMNQVQGQNLQSDVTVANANAGTLNQAQDINNRYALDFEGKMLKADALTRNDVRNWMNHNQAVNLANSNAINKLNYYNQLSEYNQITPNGIEMTTSPTFEYKSTLPVDSVLEAKKVLAEAKKKEKEALKKKNGGRIKRKL